MSQKEVLLDLFRKRGVISNHELRRLQPPIYQYPTRIKELRKAGYDIETKPDPNDSRTFYYHYNRRLRLVENPNPDLERRSKKTSPETDGFSSSTCAQGGSFPPSKQMELCFS